MKSNIKYFYISQLLLISFAAFATAASSKEEAMFTTRLNTSSDRFSQIETTVDSQGQLLYQIQQQLSEFQSDIDILRGQIQENQHELNQIVKLQKDLHIQLNSLTNSLDKAKVNINNTHINHIDVTKKVTNEKFDYDAAVTLALKSKSKQQILQAINSFWHFIKIYPESNYQPNANYWLGQLSYNQGNKDDAAFYFATVVKNYPNSSKVAECLYKVGLLMQEKGQNDKAYVVYKQVINTYQNSPIAELAKKKLISL